MNILLIIDIVLLLPCIIYILWYERLDHEQKRDIWRKLHLLKWYDGTRKFRD